MPIYRVYARVSAYIDGGTIDAKDRDSALSRVLKGEINFDTELCRKCSKFVDITDDISGFDIEEEQDE
jgi:hypothetical protein